MNEEVLRDGPLFLDGSVEGAGGGDFLGHEFRFLTFRLCTLAFGGE